jgi:hypothetical protein
MLGQKNAFFTKTAFWLWVGNALYHSIVRIPFSCVPTGGIYYHLQVAFGFSVILFWGDLKSSRGYDCGHWFWGTMLYIAVLLTVLGKAALVSECVHGRATIPSPALLMVFISQHMDEVYCCRCDTRWCGGSNAHLTSFSDSGFICVHHAFPSHLYRHCSQYRVLSRVLGTRSTAVHRQCLLVYNSPCPCDLPFSRFRVEIVSPDAISFIPKY